METSSNERTQKIFKEVVGCLSAYLKLQQNHPQHKKCLLLKCLNSSRFWTALNHTNVQFKCPYCLVPEHTLCYEACPDPCSFLDTVIEEKAELAALSSGTEEYNTLFASLEGQVCNKEGKGVCCVFLGERSQTFSLSYFELK